MKRYFLELSYLGTGYAGFQVQENAPTIQSEVEKAFTTCLRKAVRLTGSSRTDAGVHAYQNYFHFDCEETLQPALLYNLNALLPSGIAVKKLTEVKPDAHSRFDALSRRYRYVIYAYKDPFQAGRGYYYPYTIDRSLLQAAASLLMQFQDFSAFSKKGGQQRTSLCALSESHWDFSDNSMGYNVVGNRFLRGMVRGLVGTMLQVGRGKLGVDELASIIVSGAQHKADFSVPAEGLYLVQVTFPAQILGG